MILKKKNNKKHLKNSKSGRVGTLLFNIFIFIFKKENKILEGKLKTSLPTLPTLPLFIFLWNYAPI